MAADGGVLNRLLLCFYVDGDEKLEEGGNWQWYEIDPEEEDEDEVEDDFQENRKGIAPLFRCRLKASMQNPTFAILGSKIYALGERDYGPTAQSFDAISAGRNCDILNPDSTKMPEALITPVVFVYKNKLYAFGPPAVDLPSSILAAAELDPAIGSWTKLNGPPGGGGFENKSDVENRIYPAYIQGNKVTLKFLGSSYIFDLDTHKWNVHVEHDYYLLGADFYRHRAEQQALVIGDFLYTCDEWDLRRGLMFLRAYNLKENIWLDDEYVILPPFPARAVLLSRTGEKTLCIVCADIISRTKKWDTSFVYCIKADLTTSVDQNTGCTEVKASNISRSPCRRYEGRLYCCLPFCSPVSEKAKNESIRHTGNKRMRKSWFNPSTSTGALDFTS